MPSEVRQIGSWQMAVDREATQSVYDRLPSGIDCECNSCRNFSAVVSNMPEAVKEFFDSFGIDLSKPSEVYSFCAPENGCILYGGFYHFVGEYLSGDDAWQPMPKKRWFRKNTVKYIDPPEFYNISEGFDIGFTHSIGPVSEEFPELIVQMEISFTLPWVLDEPYED